MLSRDAQGQVPFQTPQRMAMSQLGPIQNDFVLTEKAYNLLERPIVPPSVFIAYGTKESSAFGLACEYRLRSENIPVFIDRSIMPGEVWDPHLEETIKNSKVMVCLLAKTTIKRSDYIRKEIGLARDNGLRFIPIWQVGFNLNDDCTDELRPYVGANQAIKVTDENAASYHNAIEALVNALGIFQPHKW